MEEKKLTIGLFNDSFFPMADGVMMVVDNYARRLMKYANVVVFVPKYQRRKFDDSVFPYTVVRCASVKMPILDYSLPVGELDVKFDMILKNYDLDIVHIHSPFTLGIVGLRYAKRHNIPCIATMHAQFEQDFERAVKSEYVANLLNSGLINVFNACDECWAVNKEVARIFYEDYGYKTRPLVMDNATEMRPLADPEKAKAHINELHGISPDEKVFLFVGRINALKNIYFIADAIKALKEKNPGFRFKMLYVGSGQDERSLRKKIREDGIGDCTVMCGKVTDRELLAEYFARADLFLFPSMYDASSIVQIEAASQGTPTVFLKGAATGATAEDNVTGYFAAEDVQAYADRIIEIFSDEEAYRQVRHNVSTMLYRHWDDVVEEVYQRYLEAIERKKNAEQ